MRLSEEREVKLQRLTKSIVSAHSNKPKGSCPRLNSFRAPSEMVNNVLCGKLLYLPGRQVKMAFIHTAAKPPRNVRIQQELHGTAVQPPPQLGTWLVSAPSI